METRSAQQIEYERRIARCNDNKRALYERFVLRALDAERYKTLKAEVDAEMTRLERANAAVKEQVTQMLANREAKIKAREIAGTASRESKLSRELVDLLIEKVLIYPGNEIEIVWKVSDFVNQNTYSLQ